MTCPPNFKLASRRARPKRRRQKASLHCSARRPFACLQRILWSMSHTSRPFGRIPSKTSIVCVCQFDESTSLSPIISIIRGRSNFTRQTRTRSAGAGNDRVLSRHLCKPRFDDVVSELRPNCRGELPSPPSTSQRGPGADAGGTRGACCAHARAKC